MSLTNSPFKFLDSYQQADADVYFGREKETQDLYNALSGVKHLMVYGPSGSGKTSLVECGLRNQFSDADWYAITIRKGADINASVFAGINLALHDKIEIDPDSKMPTDPQMEFGPAVEQLFAERFQPVYLLFDQFEELLISGETEEKKKFFTLLNKLIRNKTACRVMLIMREEFIGHLSEFEALCPSIFQHRFRVEKMGRKNVEDVIYHILEAPRYQSNFKVTDSHKLAESILSKLPDRKKEIELAHVQVFLGELWDRAQTIKTTNELPVLIPDLIHDDDNLETVLESFLKKQLKELEASFGERAPLELLAAMISERFTKLQLSEAAIKTDLELKKVHLKKPIAELLKALEKRRIIRPIDDTQYEISHDVLALLVGQNLTEEMKLREKAGDIYKVYGERKGLFTQDDIDYLRPFQESLAYPSDLQTRIGESIAAIKNHHEQEKARTKKRLHTLYSLLGASLIALLFGGFYYFEALNQTEKAKNQTEIAEKEKNNAVKSDSLAQIEKEKAMFSNSSAQIERNNAFKALIASRKSDSLAQIDKRNAEESKNKFQKQALTSQALLLNSTAKDLLSKGLKTEALRVGEVAYSTALQANPHPPTPLSFLLENAFYAEIPFQLFKVNLLSSINEVAFSPDGKQILFATGFNTVLLGIDGNKTQVFDGHSSSVTSVAFSPNGKNFLTGSFDGTAILWGIDGNQIHTFGGDRNHVQKVAFSPDGEQVLIKSYDGTAILWGIDGNKIAAFEGPSAVVDLAFSPDGKYILTGNMDNTAILWRIDGTRIQTFVGHCYYVTSVAFSPDGKQILTGSIDHTAVLWGVDGNKIAVFEGPSAVLDVAFSPDGKHVLSGSADDTAILWGIEGNQIHTLGGYSQEVTSVAFSPDGKNVLAGSDDGTAILWGIDGNQIHAFVGHGNYVSSVAFSPNGKQVLTGSHDGSSILWDVDGKQIQIFEGNDYFIISVAFSPDGNQVLTGSGDGTATLWGIDGKRIQTFEGHSFYVSSVAFSPDGKQVLTGSRDGTAILWGINGNRIETFEGYQDAVYAVFSPDGKQILAGSWADPAILWGIDGRKTATFEGDQRTVTDVAFSFDGKQVLTGSRDGTATLWGIEGNKIVVFEGHKDNVSSIAFSPDGKQVLTGSSDRTAILWGIDGTRIHTFEEHSSSVFSVAFSPDGKQVLTGSSDLTTLLRKTPAAIYEWLLSPLCPIRQLTQEEKVMYGVIEEEN